MARLKFLQTDFLLALFVVLQISGCSLFSPKIALHDVTVDVEPLANNNTPLYVDFVAAGDEKMLERLKGTPASQWFEQRAQLQRDYPQGFSVWSLEVVPGQFVRFKDPPCMATRLWECCSTPATTALAHTACYSRSKAVSGSRSVRGICVCSMPKGSK